MTSVNKNRPTHSGPTHNNRPKSTYGSKGPNHTVSIHKSTSPSTGHKNLPSNYNKFHPFSDFTKKHPIASTVAQSTYSAGTQFARPVSGVVSAMPTYQPAAAPAALPDAAASWGAIGLTVPGLTQPIPNLNTTPVPLSEMKTSEWYRQHGMTLTPFQQQSSDNSGSPINYVLDLPKIGAFVVNRSGPSSNSWQSIVAPAQVTANGVTYNVSTGVGHGTALAPADMP